MSLALTPERVAAVYECLREFQPFAGWRMPRVADLEFAVTRHVDRHADTDAVRDWKRLRVSSATNGHFSSISAAVAHEMVHIALHVAGSANWANHGPEFKRYATRVCRAFGWDEKNF